MQTCKCMLCTYAYCKCELHIDALKRCTIWKLRKFWLRPANRLVRQIDSFQCHQLAAIHGASHGPERLRRGKERRKRWHRERRRHHQENPPTPAKSEQMTRIHYWPSTIRLRHYRVVYIFTDDTCIYRLRKISSFRQIWIRLLLSMMSLQSSYFVPVIGSMDQSEETPVVTPKTKRRPIRHR